MPYVPPNRKDLFLLMVVFLIRLLRNFFLVGHIFLGTGRILRRATIVFLSAFGMAVMLLLFGSLMASGRRTALKDMGIVISCRTFCAQVITTRRSPISAKKNGRENKKK